MCLEEDFCSGFDSCLIKNNNLDKIDDNQITFENKKYRLGKVLEKICYIYGGGYCEGD